MRSKSVSNHQGSQISNKIYQVNQVHIDGKDISKFIILPIDLIESLQSNAENFCYQIIGEESKIYSREKYFNEL